MATNNPYLRLISGGETVTIPACKGGATANIYNTKETFPGYVDNNFVNYGCNTPQPATEKTYVDVYEMHNKNGDFRTLFGSLGSDLKSLAFESQEQIVTFCKENKQWLRKDGYGTFFLFTEENFFVAGVRFYSGELKVNVYRLSDGYVWPAGDARRLVVPAAKNSDTQS